jgi:hypothetical protein
MISALSNELVQLNSLLKIAKTNFSTATNDVYARKDITRRFNSLMEWGLAEFEKKHYSDAQKLLGLSFESEIEYGPAWGIATNRYRLVFWPIYSMACLMTNDPPEAGTNEFKKDMTDMVNESFRNKDSLQYEDQF